MTIHDFLDDEMKARIVGAALKNSSLTSSKFIQGAPKKPNISATTPTPTAKKPSITGKSKKEASVKKTADIQDLKLQRMAISNESTTLSPTHSFLQGQIDSDDFSPIKGAKKKLGFSKFSAKISNNSNLPTVQEKKLEMADKFRLDVKPTSTVVEKRRSSVERGKAVVEKSTLPTADKSRSKSRPNVVITTGPKPGHRRSSSDLKTSLPKQVKVVSKTKN